MVIENPPDKILRTWKIKLKNTDLLKPIFQKWFYDYKYAYNKAKWLIDTTTSHYSDIDLRNLIIPKEVNSHIPWFLETPKDIRAEAVFEIVKNYKTAFTNLKNKNIKFFEMGFMKKRLKKTRYCFGLPGTAIKVIDSKCIQIYPSYTNNFCIKTSKKIPDYCIKNKHLLKEHKIYFNGESFYLLLTIERNQIIIKNRSKLTAIDPGVRKLVTTWAPETERNKSSYSFGSRKSIQIRDLLRKRDMYQSCKDFKNYNKVEIRIKNLTDELHHRTSTFLCKNYSSIILPELDVRSLIKKTQSKQYRKTMLRMRIKGFNNLLKTKAEIYNTKIICNSVTEAYSSRLCSSCRVINKKCSNSIKNCSNCGLCIDRDINGAKNIYYMNKHLA